jgi:hypothetical protein
MTETHRLTYAGHPALASAFVQMLQESGLEVEWTRPEEQRGLSDVPQEVVVGVLVTGTTAAIKAGVKAATTKFRERFPRGGRVEDQDDDSSDED